MHSPIHDVPGSRLRKGWESASARTCNASSTYSLSRRKCAGSKRKLIPAFVIIRHCVNFLIASLTSDTLMSTCKLLYTTFFYLYKKSKISGSWSLMKHSIICVSLVFHWIMKLFTRSLFKLTFVQNIL